MNISTLSTDFIQNYSKYVTGASANKVSTEDMFKKLSEQMGGDGKTITKDELDSYIENADEDMSSTKLDALKSLQSNWDTISNGEDSITFSDVKDSGSTNLLGLAYTSDVVSSLKASESTTSDVLGSLVNSALNGTSTQSDVSSYLTTLLSENSATNDNSDEIDAVVNLLAKYGPNNMNSEAVSILTHLADYQI